VSANQYQYGDKVTICHKGKNTITAFASSGVTTTAEAATTCA
jgi:hypothetical protein